MTVADLRRDPQRCPRRLARDEVHRLGHDAVAARGPPPRPPDRVALGVEIDDVERAAGREAEASPLADRVGRDPGVRAEHAPLAVDDRARSKHLGRAATQESAVVVVGHEADLLALGLVGGDQAEAARVRPHLVLRQVADRKPRRPELRLA